MQISDTQLAYFDALIADEVGRVRVPTRRLRVIYVFNEQCSLLQVEVSVILTADLTGYFPAILPNSMVLRSRLRRTSQTLIETINAHVDVLRYEGACVAIGESIGHFDDGGSAISVLFVAFVVVVRFHSKSNHTHRWRVWEVRLYRNEYFSLHLNHHHRRFLVVSLCAS